MSISSIDPIDQLLTLLEDPRVKAFFEKMIDTTVEKKIKESYETQKFKASVEEIILTSECRPIQRIAKLEEITGLADFSDFEEENHEPTIPERIQSLEEKITNFEERPTVSLTENKTPKTKTEIRASLLVNALTASGKPYLSTPEIMTFLKCKLPENCKIDEGVQNIRKVKQDVVKKAAEMFSHVKMNKKTTGHKDVRLILVS